MGICFEVSNCCPFSRRPSFLPSLSKSYLLIKSQMNRPLSRPFTVHISRDLSQFLQIRVRLGEPKGLFPVLKSSDLNPAEVDLLSFDRMRTTCSEICRSRSASVRTSSVVLARLAPFLGFVVTRSGRQSWGRMTSGGASAFGGSMASCSSTPRALSASLASSSVSTLL